MGLSAQRAKRISKQYIQEHDDWLELGEIMQVAHDGELTYVRSEVKLSELLGYTQVILKIEPDGTVVGERIFAKYDDKRQ